MAMEDSVELIGSTEQHSPPHSTHGWGMNGDKTLRGWGVDGEDLLLAGRGWG